MKKVLPVLIASATGLTILAGYFFQAQLAPVLGLLIHWGILLAGLGGLIGIVYLLKMHLNRIGQHKKGSFFSVVVLVSFVFTVAVALIFTPQHPFFRNWVLNIQTTVETSLLAVLAVVLLYTSLFFVRTRGWTLMSISFLASALISLVLNLGYIQLEQGSAAAEYGHFIRRLPITGLRGILIGIALGGLIMGMRVLLAIDRPYDGES
jgi:hypothetical protein